MPGGSDGGAAGLFSFIGIVVIALATLGKAVDALQLLAPACILASVVALAVFWAAYRVHGRLRLAAGLTVVALAGYAVWTLNDPGTARIVWVIATVLVVGLDQFALKTN